MEAGIAALVVKYGGVAALVILLGERLARLTPNKTDDKIVDVLRKGLRIVGVDFPNIEKSEEGVVTTVKPVEGDK